MSLYYTCPTTHRGQQFALYNQMCGLHALYPRAQVDHNISTKMLRWGFSNASTTTQSSLMHITKWEI